MPHRPRGAALAAFVLCSCAGTGELPPNPIAATVRATFSDELPLAGPLPFTSDSVSLHVSSFQGRDHLAIVIYGSTEDDSCVVLLPAWIESEPGGWAITLLGEGGSDVTFTLPLRPEQRVLASRGVLGSVSASYERADGTREVAEVDVSRAGDRASLEITIRQEGPSSFGSFGRVVEAEQGPLRVTIRRTKAAMRGELWVPTP